MSSFADQHGDDQDIPNMDANLNDNGCPTVKAAADAEIMNFSHFFVFVMLRHIFGSWLPNVKGMPNWSNLYLTTHHNSNNEGENDASMKENRRTMRLRKLKLENGKCEVYPSLSEVPTIPEGEILL